MTRLNVASAMVAVQMMLLLWAFIAGAWWAAIVAAGLGPLVGWTLHIALAEEIAADAYEQGLLDGCAVYGMSHE